MPNHMIHQAQAVKAECHLLGFPSQCNYFQLQSSSLRSLVQTHRVEASDAKVTLVIASLHFTGRETKDLSQYVFF